MHFKRFHQSYLIFISSLIALSVNTGAQETKGPTLAPLMIKKGKLIVSNDFSEDTVKFNLWTTMVNTKWSAKAGILEGLPATKEEQEKVGGAHNGQAPAVKIDFGNPTEKVPNVCIELKVRFRKTAPEGSKGKVSLASHGPGLHFMKDRIEFTTAYQVLHQTSSALYLKEGEWYHCMIEVFENEAVFQIKNGPTFYGNHPSINLQEKAEKGQAVMIGGPKQGIVDIDEIFIWSVEENVQADWHEEKTALVKKYKPVLIEKKKKKKKKKKSKNK